MFFTQVKTGSPIFGFILVFLLMAISVLAACNSEKPSHQDAIRQFTECFERFDDISVDAIEYYNGMDASGKGGGNLYKVIAKANITIKQNVPLLGLHVGDKKSGYYMGVFQRTERGWLIRQCPDGRDGITDDPKNFS